MKRTIYLDILKIIAIVGVVLNHSYWYLSSNNLLSYSVKTFILLAVKFAVPVFLMVSGALLLHKKDSFKNIFCKRILRVLVPLIVITIIWSIFDKKNLMRLPIYLVELDVNNGAPYWGWYIYVLIAIYLVLPFLQKMVKDFKDNDYKMFIILFLFAPSFISFGCKILDVFFSKSIYVTSYITGTIFSEYIALFVAGYYLSKQNITKKGKNVAIITLILSLTVALILEIINYKIYHSALLLDNCLLPTAIIPAISIFIIIKYYFDDKIKKKSTKKSTIYMSNLVFGIYLFHVFFVQIIYNFNFMKEIFSFNSFIGLLILDLLVFLSSGITALILRKIPIVNKFL